MSVNSSSNSSFYQPYEDCFYSRTNIFTLSALSTTYILFLLPVFILVIYVGYQRYRKQLYSSPAAMNSHSDIFTFNMVSLELFGVFGTCLCSVAAYTKQQDMLTVGLCIYTIISPAQTVFHLLTCVDRYLAVIHPITYLGLRQVRRVRIRNIIIGCVWLLCIASLGLVTSFNFYIILNILFLTWSSIIASFCSLSVLCVLIRPGPGEVGENRERVDQSKKRAFHVIIVITGVTFLRFLSILVFNSALASSMICYIDCCSAILSICWLSLPSSLVLPLLFLHRAGKLPGCKQNPGSV